MYDIVKSWKYLSKAVFLIPHNWKVCHILYKEKLPFCPLEVNSRFQLLSLSENRV